MPYRAMRPGPSALELLWARAILVKSRTLALNRSRHLHPGLSSIRAAVPPGARSQKLPVRGPPRPTLHSQHLTFTHGGNFWRDNYLLEKWATSEQPVVYLGQTHGGYKLLRRLGDWCWLTKDPVSG